MKGYFYTKGVKEAQFRLRPKALDFSRKDAVGGTFELLYFQQKLENSLGID